MKWHKTNKWQNVDSFECAILCAVQGSDIQRLSHIHPVPNDPVQELTPPHLWQNITLCTWCSTLRYRVNNTTDIPNITGEADLWEWYSYPRNGKSHGTPQQQQYWRGYNSCILLAGDQNKRSFLSCTSCMYICLGELWRYWDREGWKGGINTRV